MTQLDIIKVISVLDELIHNNNALSKDLKKLAEEKLRYYLNLL